MRRNIDIEECCPRHIKIIKVVENGGFPVAIKDVNVDDNFAKWLDHVNPEFLKKFSKIVWPEKPNYESIFLTLQDNEAALVLEEAGYKKQAEMEKSPVWAKEIEAVIKEIAEEKSALAKLKKKLSLLIVLRKKILKSKDKILEAFSDFDFTPEESSKVITALLEGDLRVTNLVKHDWKYLFWWFITFKWNHFLYLGKQFSKEDILRIADFSAKNKAFERTPAQERNKILLGGTLAGGKMATSSVLCFVFAACFLNLFFNPAIYIVLVIAVFLALCNIGICYLSRGKAMIDAAGFEPEKQKVKDSYEENCKEKSQSDRGAKVFVGVLTMLACISAGVTAWSGLSGLLVFFGVAALLSNPFVILAFVVLCAIAALSFYTFQAAGVEKNFSEFKNLFVKFYGKGGPSGVAKVVLLSVVSIVFLAVYATLTWFIVSTGINKIFGLCGKQPDLLSFTISAIGTTATMFVNMFSQVCKVFNPKTYQEIHSSIGNARNECGNPKLSRSNRFANTAKIIAKTVMLSGDVTTYCIAGGIQSGASTGASVGNAIEWAGAKLAFTILTPIILSAVAITFSFSFIFGTKKEENNKSVSTPASASPPPTNINTELPSQELRNESSKISVAQPIHLSNSSWRFWNRSHPTNTVTSSLTSSTCLTA